MGTGVLFLFFFFFFPFFKSFLEYIIKISTLILSFLLLLIKNYDINFIGRVNIIRILYVNVLYIQINGTSITY